MSDEPSPASTAMQVTVSPLVQEGTMVLMKGNVMIWIGRIGSPIEDLVLDIKSCDGVILNRADGVRLKAAADLALLFRSRQVGQPDPGGT